MVRDSARNPGAAEIYFCSDGITLITSSLCCVVERVHAHATKEIERDGKKKE